MLLVCDTHVRFTISDSNGEPYFKGASLEPFNSYCGFPGSRFLLPDDCVVTLLYVSLPHTDSSQEV